ncbi:hypothetical protein KKF69_08430 [Patescibacteria group bacterium]|nr:hypothetical protein [Patescibacteria group bacterium]MBU4017471.1 hypothetical protein [Patescibacteria group bacterium]
MYTKPYDLKNKTVKNYLTKIGEITVLMGFLESWVDFWILELIEASGNASEKQTIGKKITSGIMLYKQKLDLLLTLVQSKTPEKIIEFNKLYEKLKFLGVDRNSYIHSQWFIMYGNKKEHIKRDTHKLDLRHGLNRKDGSIKFAKSFSNEKLSDITRFINSIGKTHNDLTKFFINI